MPRADESDLLAFLAVACERSFTKAAVKLGDERSCGEHDPLAEARPRTAEYPDIKVEIGASE